MDLQVPTTHIKKFDGTSFSHWHQLVLLQYNVWRLVKGREPEPKGTETAANVLACSDKKDHALAIIGLGLG